MNENDRKCFASFEKDVLN